jgi:preprotein translocase subunit SecF
MLQFFSSAKFNFIGNKNKAFWFSGALLLITVVSMLAPIYPNRGLGPNLSIDFVGGTVVQMKFANAIAGDLNRLRDIAGNIGYGKPEVKTVGRVVDNEVEITVKLQKEKALLVDELKAAFAREYPDNPFEVRRVETVGPKVGAELGRTAVLSIILSFLAIVAYVGVRFSFPFGVAAVIALVHDVVLTVGLFSVLNIEISLPVIAALLTIAGYSINDTIVIFDRIRENIGEGLSKKSFEDRVNEAINQTLSRTFITSITTLFTVTAVGAAFLGSGDVVFDFALALTFGILIGTYSTWLIASPIVVLWNKRWPIK